jgi:hypothetical protein
LLFQAALKFEQQNDNKIGRISIDLPQTILITIEMHGKCELSELLIVLFDFSLLLQWWCVRSCCPTTTFKFHSNQVFIFISLYLFVFFDSKKISPFLTNFK